MARHHRSKKTHGQHHTFDHQSHPLQEVKWDADQQHLGIIPAKWIEVSQERLESRLANANEQDREEAAQR